MGHLSSWRKRNWRLIALKALKKSVCWMRPLERLEGISGSLPCKKIVKMKVSWSRERIKSEEIFPDLEICCCSSQLKRICGYLRVKTEFVSPLRSASLPAK